MKRFLLSALLACSASVYGQVLPGLFSTGVDGSNVLLTPGTTDSHYVLTYRPSGVGTSLIATTAVPGVWRPDGGNSAWIAPTASSISDPTGLYRFETTFNFSGTEAQADLLQINGLWTADNIGVGIVVNDTYTGFTIFAPEDYGTWHSFSLSGSYFATGPNTIAFEVLNIPGSGLNPVGLRVEYTSAQIIPEPSTYAVLTGLAVLALVAFRRFRRRAT
jgi:hypothetical protein